MTTGRINQVAFLTDAGRRTSRAGRPCPRRERTSSALSVGRFVFGANRGRGTSHPDGLPHPRDRARHRGPTTRARSEARRTRDKADASLSAPRRGPEGRDEGRIRDFGTVECPRDRYAAQETLVGQDGVLSQQLKWRARGAVAARAGNRHARTRRSPLTRPDVRDARTRKPSSAVRQCF